MKINPLHAKIYLGARVPNEVRRVLEALALDSEMKLGRYVCEVLTQHARRYARKVERSAAA